MPQSNVPTAIAILEDAAWKLRQALDSMAPGAQAFFPIIGAHEQIQQVLKLDVFKPALSEEKAGQ